MYVVKQFLNKKRINRLQIVLLFIINYNKILPFQKRKMQDFQPNNQKICLLCCQERDIFVLPICNHKHVCWKCCMNMIKLGKFQCPFCKGSANDSQMIIFVTFDEMIKHTHQDIKNDNSISMLRSESNQNYFYTSADIADKIQYQTSYNCPFQSCDDMSQNLNQLKKHLDIIHHRQYCDVCLTNRKCIHSQQILYSSSQYQKHIKNGEFTDNGDLILYHPFCQFCKEVFYDIDQFKKHLEKNHQKCFICHQSNQSLKYVYFRDYQQAIQHFKKSHFYCQIGNCMMTKFENVFVSEEILNEHINRTHKNTKKALQPVMNIPLGFNHTESNAVFEWDKIGKNHMAIFQMVQKHSNILKLQPVQHIDTYIDVRDFYPEQTKRTLHIQLKKICSRIQQKISDLKNSDLYIDDIEFFKPLDMTPLTRIDLQKFLNAAIADRKIASTIISKFFEGRQDFKSTQEYFTFVKTKMCLDHKIVYYYAFPQLIRFFKNENPNKPLMQKFYYQSLCELKVKKMFVIHKRSTYSEILLYLKSLIQREIFQRDRQPVDKKIKRQIDTEKYVTFLKDLNSTFYIQNQEEIFYISKEKMTNLYHMINKCKVKDFLKMNWLLKVGFSNEAYKIIQRDFYYKEQQECQNAMKKFTVQQLAYLYVYSVICLEAIFEKKKFSQNKEKPSPFFFTQILRNINFSTKSSTQGRILQLVQMQRKSVRAQISMRQVKNKGIIINKQQHPSLLDRNIEFPQAPKPKYNENKSDFPILSATSFGQIRPKVWNQAKVPTKKTIIKQEQYPTLLSTDNKQLNKWEKKEEEQFPVFQYVGKKNKKNQNNNTFSTSLQGAVGWIGSTYVPSQWNQEQTAKSWQKRLDDEQRRKQRQKAFEEQEYQRQNTTKKQEDLQAKVQLVGNLVSNKTLIKKQQKIQQKAIQQAEPMMLVISKGKKNNLIDQDSQFSESKKKGKKNKNNKIQKEQEQEQESGLFQKIQKQSQIISKKIKKQINPFEHFNQVKPSTQEKPKKVQNFKVQMRKYNDFEPIIGNEGQFPCISMTIPKKQVQKQQEKGPYLPLKPQKQKKTKIRLDDTSSEDQKPVKKPLAPQKKIQQKAKPTSQQFGSISDTLKRPGQQKKSIVNVLIENAQVEEVPNIIKIKKGRNGKKEIFESVNFRKDW